jgi:hypothetical protein
MARRIPDYQQQLDEQRRKVDVDNYDVTLREIIKMVQEKELNRAPDYQRKFRWSNYDESRLIESLFLGLPIPSIFVATNQNGTWELVDGLQRVSTLIHFVSDSPDLLKSIGREQPLVLEGLEKLDTFTGKNYAELPTALQLQFMKRSLRVTSLSDKSDPDVRFDLFERLNTGGVALSGQEVRACIYRGPFSKLLRNLAHEHDFSDMLKLQRRRQNDGTKEEFVLRFFALLQRRSSYTGDLKKFLNASMKEFSKAFNVAEGKRRFHAACSTLRKLIPGQFVRVDLKVTPLNQFEGCLVAIGEMLSRGETPTVTNPHWISDPQLVEYSTKASNSREKVMGRIRRSIELFGGTVPEDLAN